MEFAFIYDLTPETQLLAATGYGTDLNFLCIRGQLGSYISYLTEKICDLYFLKGCATNRMNGKMH